MSTFSSSSNGQLAYIAEVTPGTTPGAGNGTKLRMTGPTMKAAVSTVKSNEIRSDRLVTGSTRTDLNVDGGFNFELSGKEYDPFLESALSCSFAHYGTAGLTGAAFSATTAANTVTAAVAPTGSDAFTTLAQGSWFKLVPPSGSAQAIKDYFADKWFKVSSTTAPTATVITLDASTPIAAPGLVTAIAGYKITQSIISNSNSRKYFTMEYSLADVNEFMTFKGMRVNDLSLAIDVGAIVTGSFSFMGLSHVSAQATALPGTLQASQTLDVMNAVTDVGTVYEAGTDLLAAGSFIKGVKLQVNNNLRGQKAVAVYGSAGIGEGELALSGSLDVYFPDATYYRKWLNGTNTDLALGVADSLGNGYLIELPKVTFRDVALNAGSNNSDVMLTLPFDAFYSANLGKGIRITRAVSA